MDYNKRKDIEKIIHRRLLTLILFMNITINLGTSNIKAEIPM